MSETQSLKDRMAETTANYALSYEKFVKGMMAIAVQQLELTRGLMEGGMEDLNLLAKARTPDAFVEAELAILRRRAERTIGAVHSVAEEMRQIWTDTLETASGKALNKEP
jgi:hypothetical protein